MQQPQVSVIMPVYNTAAYLGPSIESVRQQQGVTWELLIVDDASTDDTPAIAHAYAAMDKRIRVMPNERAKGPGGARNTGMAHAVGKTCFFLDGDDLLYPGSLEGLYAFWEANNAPMVCAALTVFCHLRWLFIPGSMPRKEGAEKNQITGYPVVGICLHLYDRVFLKNNFLLFPEHLPVGEDGAFICRAYSLLDAVPVINRPVLLYRINHKKGIASGANALSAINYFLLVRECFDKAGKHALVAPYLEFKFKLQWLERIHAALADGRETALLFMQKCAELLHDMVDEVRPFLDDQLGEGANTFWEYCRNKDAAGMLSVMQHSVTLKGQSAYMGIDKPCTGPAWFWYLFSRRLANLIRRPETIHIMRYMRRLRKKSLTSLANRTA